MIRNLKRTGTFTFAILLLLSVFTQDAYAKEKLTITITPDKEEAYLVGEQATFAIEIKKRQKKHRVPKKHYKYPKIRLEQIEATFPDEATRVDLTQVDRNRYIYTTPEFTEEGNPTLSITVRTHGAAKSIERLERVKEIFERRIDYWKEIREETTDERLKKRIDKMIARYQRVIERIEKTIERIKARGIIGQNSCTIEVIAGAVPDIVQMEEGFNSGDWESLCNSAEALKEMGKSATPVLVNTFQDKTKDKIFRKMVAEIVGEIKDSNAVEPLITVLNDASDEEYIRAEAAFTLGKIRDERALNSLLSVLNDESEQIRSSAATGLGLLGKSEAVEPLIGKLGDESELMRIRTIGGLSMLGDPRAVEPLINLLADESESIASQAILALGILKDVRAVEPLLDIVQNRTGLRLVNAIKALGQIGNPRAVDSLITILEGDDEYLFMNAGMALAQIGDIRAVDPLAAAIERASSEFARNKLKEAYKVLTGEDYSG